MNLQIWITFINTYINYVFAKFQHINNWWRRKLPYNVDFQINIDKI